MLSPLALTILIIAAVFFLVLNLLRSLAKAISITLVILVLVGFLLGYMVIKDAKEFTQTLNENKTTYLLDEGDAAVRTGFQAVRLNLSTFTPLSPEEIAQIRDQPPGKIFLINKDILNLTVDYPELSAQGLDIGSLLESTTNEFRSQGFVLALGRSIEEQGTFDMVMHIRDGNITIEPKTAVVYVLTSTPRQIYKEAKGFIVGQTTKRLNLLREEVSG
ncbi:MAG: hypothetical protein KC535_02140 [Nanoarchaeota archaeon]|nr:hypothetical protein [Nanoarchaeota archaeon]